MQCNACTAPLAKCALDHRLLWLVHRDGYARSGPAASGLLYAPVQGGPKK